jgi:hypothetical protein
MTASTVVDRQFWVGSAPSLMTEADLGALPGAMRLQTAEIADKRQSVNLAEGPLLS